MDKRNETVMETRRREYAAAGVKPLEWRLYPIESISDGSRLGYLSKLFVNSLKLGVIAPETYEPSTAATLRGAKLAMWQLEETRHLSAVYAACRGGKGTSARGYFHVAEDVPRQDGETRFFRFFVGAFGNGSGKDMLRVYGRSIVYGRGRPQSEIGGGARKRT